MSRNFPRQRNNNGPVVIPADLHGDRAAMPQNCTKRLTSALQAPRVGGDFGTQCACPHSPVVSSCAHPQLSALPMRAVCLALNRTNGCPVTTP